MAYCADSYAAMLLCLSLSPDRDEYARMLSTAEYRELRARIRTTSARRISGLMNVDISGIMQLLSITEEEAYRIYTLMNRTVQLSYAMEAFAMKGIRIVTEFDDEYPRRLAKRSGQSAPPVLYVYGDSDLLNSPAVGILGISGIKTEDAVRSSIAAIAGFANGAGYRVMTGGELGVSRVTEGFVLDGDCALTSVLGGGLMAYIDRPEIRRLYDENRLVAISLEHPDAPFTAPRAIPRNKMLMSLAEAVFVFNTDGKRGESDAIRAKTCDWIYAWNGYPENRSLINRGATGFDEVTESWLNEMSARWIDSRSEQLDLFDLLD
ncbi:MAG: DNA-processing protein DprA [Christensenellales bacterium]|jgi:predicted Rossmann fold nucleotide-binding protein DprA/Smf involved in DNA uptake